MYGSVVIKMPAIVHPSTVGEKVRVLPTVSDNLNHTNAQFKIGVEGVITSTSNMYPWDCTVKLNENFTGHYCYFLFSELELIS